MFQDQTVQWKKYYAVSTVSLYKLMVFTCLFVEVLNILLRFYF